MNTCVSWMRDTIKYVIYWKSERNFITMKKEYDCTNVKGKTLYGNKIVEE